MEVKGGGDLILILIVEDDAKSRKLVRDVLEFSGYSVVEAASFEEGARLTAEMLPALIVMDIQLPDGDGVSLLGRLREDPATRHIPAIAVTAFAMRSEEERFLAAGFAEYVSKPIDISALRHSVARVLQSTRRQDVS